MLKTVPRQQTYLLAGGGTGGHLFPGIAVAEELLRRHPDARPLFVGSERSIESEILGRYGLKHVSLPALPSTMLRRHPLRFAWKNWRAYRTAHRLLRRDRPAAVIGLGGFAGVPVVLAASALRIPVLLLEQNVIPGRATRLLSGRATLVCLSFEQTVPFLRSSVRSAVTGNPVRAEIADLVNLSRSDTAGRRGTVLVLGGSQGAVSVNDMMLRATEILGQVLADQLIVHQTGESDCDRVRKRYADLNREAVVEPFFRDLRERYRRAEVVISRAGATTLAELSCAGCPAILIPYPHAVNNHQLRNAQAYESAGAARIVQQNRDEEIPANELADHLRRLLTDEEQRADMTRGMRSLAKPRAAELVIDHLEQIVLSQSNRVE